MDYSQALDKIEEIVILILKCPFGRTNSSPIFPKEAIELLLEVAEKSESNRRKKNFGVIGGSSAGIIGGALAITGAALIPVTFGASIGLLIAGTATGVAGASVSIGFSLDKFFRDKGRRTLIKPTLEKFVEFQKNLGSTIAQLKVVMDVVGDQRNRQHVMDLAMPLRIQKKLSVIVEDLIHLKKTVEEGNHFDAYELIRDLSYFAEQLTGCLDEILRPVRVFLHVEENWYENEMKEAKQNPFDLLDSSCFEQLQAGGEFEGRVFFQFAKRLFDVDPSDSVDNTAAMSQTAVVTGNAAVKSGALTSRVALQVADIGEDAAKVGANALRIAKGVSVAGIILGAVGVAVDLAFLGHAVYDLVKKKPEEFANALVITATIMENINDLSILL